MEQVNYLDPVLGGHLSIFHDGDERNSAQGFLPEHYRSPTQESPLNEGLHIGQRVKLTGNLCTPPPPNLCLKEPEGGLVLSEL